MKSGQRWTWALWTATVCALGASAEANATLEKADSLFQAAVEQVGRVPVKESLRAFDRVLKADGNCAPAHHENAKLYISLDTPESRQWARSALDRALHLDPKNVTYQMTLGDLLWAQGLWLQAREQYERILKAQPDNARAAFGIGYYHLKDFLKYQDVEHVDKVEGGREGSTYHLFRWNGLANLDREKATFYLDRCIASDPRFRDAYYQSGILYVESGQPKGLIHEADRLLKQYPEDKDALLFCGLGYQTVNAFPEAQTFYARALSRMGPEERAMMESVDLVGAAKDRKQIAQTKAVHQDGDTSQAWTDNSGPARFWQNQDPLFLTPFNERRMKHYGRVAYANLRFSQPSRKLEGWQTGMEKTIIHEDDRDPNNLAGSVEHRVRYILPEKNRFREEMVPADGRAETAVTARYVGQRRDDLAYLQIDMGQMPRGVYKLSVTVRDTHTGRTAARETLFRVLE